jgi:riboflavin kinase / FMN adenylyltransferase
MSDFINLPPSNNTPTTVTIGVFDGVHLGHQALLTETVRLAREQGQTPMVLTFDPHPTACLAPDSVPALLMTPEERERRLLARGIERVVIARFDTEFASLSAIQFVKDILQNKLQTSTVVIGEDFRFGKGRTGDADFLRDCGMTVHTVASVLVDGVPARSTTIRAALLAGELETANRLLGEVYSLTGVVVQGQQKGRTIGFPTANLQTDPRVLIPAAGVYAGRVTINNTPYLTAISVGVNPTIGDHLPTTVEAYVLDFDGDLYGQTLTLSFTEYLRPMVKFTGLEALKTQIADDVLRVRSTKLL